MHLRRIVGLLVGAVALSLCAGCAGDRETTLAPSAPVADSGTTPMFVPMPRDGMAVPQTTYSVTRRVRAAYGGELSIAGMRVQFPAGSLPSDNYITFVVKTKEFVEVSIKPAGLALRSPAILTLDDLTKTDGTAYHGLAFYQTASPGPVQQPTSNDWRRPQAWVSTTGDFYLGGTRWDIAGTQGIRYLCGSGYVTQYVTVASGGLVQCDRIKVTIPPNALRNNTFITIHQLSVDGNLVAELEPHGLQFQAAVTLEFNLSSLPWQPYSDWTIFWLNDNTDTWENQGGTFRNQRVSTQVWHFSDWAPARGRAGW